MNNREPHGIRNAVLLALFLVGGAILADMYMSGNVPRDENHVSAGVDTDWVSGWIAETPIFSILPRWLLDRWAVPISRERNASVLKNVLEVFNPSLRSFLTSVPIILDSSVNTARAYPAKGYIAVSPDWDNTVLQSKYRAIYEQRGMKPEDPIFVHRFKTNLLIHEYLHILQVHQGVDRQSCAESIARWYMDPRYGIPAPNTLVNADATNDKEPKSFSTNRMKYILWHQLYDYQRLNDVPQDESWKNMRYVERYRSAKNGVEEFAYIGEGILSSGSDSENYIKTSHWSDNDWKEKKMKLLEVSPEIIALYRGLFNPKLTQ
jgi:hypothetical protein